MSYFIHRKLLVHLFLLFACINVIAQEPNTVNWREQVKTKGSVLLDKAGSDAEKTQLKEALWTICGITASLEQYRDRFLNGEVVINFFPTAYYHTTATELINILDRKYDYPLEKMKQMMAFYDAYQFNRQNWDLGNKAVVERHWKAHFEYAKTHDKCIHLGYVLALAIMAHVQFDLPRALDYAYDHRFERSLPRNNPGLLSDFQKSNSLFKNTRVRAIADIKTINSYCNDFLTRVSNFDNGIAVGAMNEAPDSEFKILLKAFGLKPKLYADEDVIYMREESWRLYASGDVTKGFEGYKLLGQPLTSHEPLINIGKSILPLNSLSTGQPFNINVKDVTLGTDKDFKWYDWNEAPEAIKLTARHINKYLNKQTNKYETIETDILSMAQYHCISQVALIDLNDNGIFGLAKLSQCPDGCGTMGCLIELYEDGGLLHIQVSEDHGVKPAPVGVGLRDGSKLPFEPYTYIHVDEVKAKKNFTYR